MNVHSFGIVACLLVGASSSVHAQVGAQLIAGGLSDPTHVTQPPGESNRLFICEKAGLIKIVKDGVLLPTPFLDLTAIVDDFAEGGMLSLAFAPDYQTSGFFYVAYVSVFPNPALVVEEFNVSFASPDIAIPFATRQVLYELYVALGGHFGGCIQFGPDGMLYVSVGDTGDPTLPQDRLSNHGKILRFDPSLPAPMIPPDNPFVGVPDTNDTIFDIGLRNPWRFSFDRDTGDMWIADVGFVTFEEINFIPAADLGRNNYGWPCHEAILCTGSAECMCNVTSLTFPIEQYSHTTPINTAIIGGFVYRGTAIPSLQGRYIHADYVGSDIRSIVISGGMATDKTSHAIELCGTAGYSLITSFGQDNAGELYFTSPGAEAGDGQLLKLIPVGGQNYCTSEPNSFSAGATMSMSGSASFTANNLVIEANDVPNEFGIFFFGDTPIAANFFDGKLCIAVGLGSGLWRLLPPTVGSGNINSSAIDYAVHPASLITACSTWNFQYWFRDPAGPGGTGANLTDGLRVTFTP
jgi:glucose/arabinose dehydrogenase